MDETLPVVNRAERFTQRLTRKDLLGSTQALA